MARVACSKAVGRVTPAHADAMPRYTAYAARTQRTTAWSIVGLGDRRVCASVPTSLFLTTAWRDLQRSPAYQGMASARGAMLGRGAKFAAPWYNRQAAGEGEPCGPKGMPCPAACRLQKRGRCWAEAAVGEDSTQSKVSKGSMLSDPACSLWRLRRSAMPSIALGRGSQTARQKRTGWLMSLAWHPQAGAGDALGILRCARRGLDCPATWGSGSGLQ